MRAADVEARTSGNQIETQRAHLHLSVPSVPSATLLWTRNYLSDFTILLVSYLIATYLRRELPFGKYVGSNYVWHELSLYAAIGLGLLITYVLRLAAAYRFDLSASQQHFWSALASIPMAAATLTILTPRQSGLEKGYFIITALVLTLLIVPRPRSREREQERRALLDSLAELWASRSLVRMWITYNIRSRYAQALLGILWIVLLPLATAFVMSIVFSAFMRVQIPNVPFIAYFLTGFVPWGLFNQGIAGSMRSLLGSLGLINQIYFPREVIILSALGEALVDTFFMFVALLIIDAIVGVYPHPIYILLVPVLVIEIVFTLGIMLIVSHLSVFVRDIPQLISVVLQILFYLCPIIYPLQIVPRHFQFLITLNPVAALIEAYRAIIVYNQVPDWSSVLYPAALAVASLIFGYRTFKSGESRFADMI